uniref:Activin_recp domain-containing protein n=1 Tax=Rhabditophanes sp. KR3021 TaxID=114890 RepID=A0AC35TZT3_9BILA
MSAAVVCESCFGSCKISKNGTVDYKKCDCRGTESCLGDVCFAKIELFHEEHVASIQKGCTTHVPGGLDGCYHNGQSESIHCYCTTEKCNNGKKLNNYKPSTLPTVECCDCSEIDGKKCDPANCENHCKGNYCVADLIGNEQGCGNGLPKLQNFLRMTDYIKWQGSTICARYEAGLSVINGCTCTAPTGNCNQMNKTREYQVKNVIMRNPDSQHYCYSLNARSSKPFSSETLKSSETCEGQYCFLTYTTSELAVESEEYHDAISDRTEFISSLRTSYEILAGCMKVDSDQKISVGCTKEFSGSQNSSLLSKQCICNTHLCNYDFFAEEFADVGGKKGKLHGKKLPKHKNNHKVLNNITPNDNITLNADDDNNTITTSSSTSFIRRACSVGNNPIALSLILFWFLEKMLEPTQ